MPEPSEPINISDMVARIEFPPMDLEHDIVASLPTTTVSISGFYDSTALDGLFVFEPSERAFEFWPKGQRWPWSPMLRGQGRFDNYEMTGGASFGDEVTMTLSGKFDASTMARGRLGLRAWVRLIWRRLMTAHSDGVDHGNGA